MVSGKKCHQWWLEEATIVIPQKPEIRMSWFLSNNHEPYILYYIIYIYINNVFTYLTIVIIPHQHTGRLWPPHLARQWQTACGSGAQRGAWRMVPSFNGGQNLLLSISINVCGMNIYLPSILRLRTRVLTDSHIYIYICIYIYMHGHFNRL